MRKCSWGILPYLVTPINVVQLHPIVYLCKKIPHRFSVLLLLADTQSNIDSLQLFLIAQTAQLAQTSLSPCHHSGEVSAVAV